MFGELAIILFVLNPKNGAEGGVDTEHCKASQIHVVGALYNRLGSCIIH